MDMTPHRRISKQAYEQNLQIPQGIRASGPNPVKIPPSLVVLVPKCGRGARRDICVVPPKFGHYSIVKVFLKYRL